MAARALKDFSVTVRGHSHASGGWRINASLQYRVGLMPKPGGDAEERGRGALFEGIVREGIRGRAHGATAIHVRMDIAGVVREFDFGTAGRGWGQLY